MIEYIRFKNFRVLRDAELTLGPFNVIVGPNGSGKSTVFKALEIAKTGPQSFPMTSLRTVGVDDEVVELCVGWANKQEKFPSLDTWHPHSYARTNRARSNINSPALKAYNDTVQRMFATADIFSLDPTKILETVHLQPNTVLARNGANLAGALDQLRDQSRESFQQFEAELRQWLPEFDSITFQTPATGQRSFGLRQALSKESISSANLSEGTLIALALLYIANDPKPSSVICLEEPDRGLHPRLLRDLRDSLYRLSYPEQFKIDRPPVQVIATTHSPYFLDLFREHPEEIIIAEKQMDATSKFKRLADDPELLSIISDAPLGEVWYSGVLGGVPLRKS